jgi:protein-S-isoprenylcysteine O-methyltransferase Ste14
VSWVLVQSALFVVFALLPGNAMHWGSPGIGSIAIGALIIVWSSLRLGRSLTPFPEPVSGGRFTGTGPYRFVRHPMYLGVFFIAIGFAEATHSITRAALAVGLAVFFDAKARHEECALRDRYPAYANYAKRTRKFLPFIY